jgi:secondary thiamine-phosphate synthase enzyme
MVRAMTSIETERALKAQHRHIQVQTQRCLEFIDITDRVRNVVEESRVCDGVVNVQTRHTTTAIMVGEHEPLLIEDLRKTLERLAPRHSDYHHDNFEVRTVNLCPDEEKNGHSHCKALFLRSSECLNVVEGRMDLGQWQRIFLIELDRPRSRTVSLMILGNEG